MTNPFDPMTGRWLTPLAWGVPNVGPIGGTDGVDTGGSGLGGANQFGNGHVGDSNDPGPSGLIDNRKADGSPDHVQNIIDGLSITGKMALGMASPMSLMANIGFSAASPNAHAPSTMQSAKDLFSGLFGGSPVGPIGADEGDKFGGPAGSMDFGAAPDGSKGEESYAQGGYTGGREGVPAGTVHGQEFVLSAPATRALGPDFLASLNASLSGRQPFGWG